MSSSLGALVNNLPKEDFKILLKYFTPEQAEILKQKGFYPYEYMDSIENLTIQNHHHKRLLIRSSQVKVSVIKIITMFGKFGMLLT